MLTSLRPADDGGGVIARLLEIGGVGGSAALRRARNPKSADLLEPDGTVMMPLTVEGDAVQFDYGATSGLNCGSNFKSRRPHPAHAEQSCSVGLTSSGRLPALIARRSRSWFMKTYEFDLHFDGIVEITDAQADRLFAAGCDDGTPASCEARPGFISTVRPRRSRKPSVRQLPKSNPPASPHRRSSGSRRRRCCRGREAKLSTGALRFPTSTNCFNHIPSDALFTSPQRHATAFAVRIHPHIGERRMRIQVRFIRGEQAPIEHGESGGRGVDDDAFGAVGDDPHARVAGDGGCVLAELAVFVPDGSQRLR